MSRNPDLHRINCPACGAGVDVLGGGRVLVQICPYCATELDASDGFRALRQFTGLKRPDTPFRLGMEGEIDGVHHQVIGIIGQTEIYRGREWRWVDHLLFSATHGYSWLTLERGHFIWSRRVRWDLPWQMFTTSHVEAVENRPAFNAEGRRWRYFETSTAHMSHIEGAFTWLPQLGESMTEISYLADGEMLSVEASGLEREQSLAVLLPRATVIAAFGLPSAETPHPYGGHALSPLPGKADEVFTIVTAALFAAASFLMLFWLLALGQGILPERRLALTQLPVTLDLPVTTTGRLMEVSLTANVDNAWTVIGAELEAPDGETLFDLEREIGYYSGIEDGERWSEGSTTNTIRLKPEVAGTYRLTLTSDGGETEPGFGGSMADRLTVSAREGVAAMVWPVLAFFGFVIAAAFMLLRRYLLRRRRLALGDWTDED